MSVKRSKAYYVLPLSVCAVYLFLYTPIIMLVLLSFNESPFFYTWQGFSYKWYYELFESVEVWSALQNSIIVAFSATCLSLILGVLLVLYAKRGFLKSITFFFYGTLAAPEIVLALSLLSTFVYVSIGLGLLSLIAGHTLLGLGYVIPMIYTRFQELDTALIEAAMDLGASYSRTVYSIVVPIFKPTIIGAALLVFIISFDDFLVSFFCAGSSAQTLPLYIFSVIRSGATPMINALATLLLCVSSLFVLLFSLFTLKRTMQ